MDTKPKIFKLFKGLDESTKNTTENVNQFVTELKEWQKHYEEQKKPQTPQSPTTTIPPYI